MRVAFCLGRRGVSVDFANFTRPNLDNAVAGFLQESCASPCGLVPVFACLVIAVNDFVVIVRETFSAPVPVAAVVLKYGICFMVVTVHRCALNPPFTSVTTHCKVNVNFLPPDF